MALFPVAQLREVDLGADFFDALKSSTYDIVITELATRWASWPFLLGAIRALQPEATIVIYSREDDASSRRATLAAGASAYVVKSDRGLLDLSQAVDRILGGGEQPRIPTPEVAAPHRRSEPVERPSPEPLPPVAPAVEATSDPSRTPADRPAATIRETPRSFASVASGAGRALRDREIGGPLAILAAVVAVTALLTAFLVGAGHRGNELDDGDSRPTPSTSAATTEGAPTEALSEQSLPSREQPAPDRPARPTAPSAQRPLVSDAPVAVELRPRAEVWVRLYVDGEKVLEKTLRPGEDRFFEGREVADLTIGDAAAITVFWNGTDLGNLGVEGQVRRLNLSPAGVGTGPARPRG